MADELIKQFEDCFIKLANDIHSYLNDDSIPMECYTKDIDDKFIDALSEFRVMLANNFKL
jgi:hypothetical protein